MIKENVDKIAELGISFSILYYKHKVRSIENLRIGCEISQVLIKLNHNADINKSQNPNVDYNFCPLEASRYSPKVFFFQNSRIYFPMCLACAKNLSICTYEKILVIKIIIALNINEN